MHNGKVVEAENLETDRLILNNNKYKTHLLNDK